jgi:16S rRNA (uracil1498-N3)-methyltransferase
MMDELRRSSAHVFVEDISHPVLTDGDVHHLSRVLRLKNGEVITCSDGHGAWRVTHWKDGAVESVSEVVTEPERSISLTVAIAPVKGDKTDLTIEKLVEIGIDRIAILQPLERSVVRWASDKTSQVMDRYRRIALAAAMQSRRVYLPEIMGPVSLGALGVDAVAMAEPGGQASWDGVRTLVIGPEGGFSPNELASSLPTIDLGSTILRAETAAIVGASLMVAHSRR